MRRARPLFMLAPTIVVVLACGAARMSEITITERPATMGEIAALQRNAPAAHCAYDLRESTEAVAVFQCENALTVRFASVSGRLAYACTDATEARCQQAAAPLLGITEAEAEQAPTVPADAVPTTGTEPAPVTQNVP